MAIFSSKLLLYFSHWCFFFSLTDHSGYIDITEKIQVAKSQWGIESYKAPGMVLDKLIGYHY
jgi:hypothetical protein